MLRGGFNIFKFLLILHFDVVKKATETSRIAQIQPRTNGKEDKQQKETSKSRKSTTK